MNMLRFFSAAFLLILSSALGAMEKEVVELSVTVELADEYIYTDFVEVDLNNLDSIGAPYLYTQVVNTCNSFLTNSLTIEDLSKYKMWEKRNDDEIKGYAAINTNDIIENPQREIYFEKINLSAED